MENTHKEWQDQTPKEECCYFIDHVYDAYYKSYRDESGKYERINNQYHMAIVAIGFAVTILLGLKGQFIKNEDCITVIDIVTFILPSISSVILLYLSQRGFKKKEELRENARIACKYLINKAKMEYVSCQTDDDYKRLYDWLNEEVKNLQLSQANGYFVSQESMGK